MKNEQNEAELEAKLSEKEEKQYCSVDNEDEDEDEDDENKFEYIADTNFIHNASNCKVEYDKNSDMICNFKVQNYKNKNKNNSNSCNSISVDKNEDTHGWSTIVFKPCIGTINSSSNNWNTKDIQESMTIELIKNECKNSWYKNGGHYVQCGIIGVPKIQLDKNNGLNRYVFEKALSEIDSCALMDNFNDCNLRNSKLKEFDISTYYMYFAFNSYSNQYACYLGHNNNVNFSTIYDSNSNYFVQSKYNAKYCLKAREQSKHKHCIEILIENNQLYFVRWMKNKEKDKNKNKNKDVEMLKTKHDKAGLDFDKYDYFYALSSRRCGCTDSKISGFEFLAQLSHLQN